jgi:hypothetical protein
MHYTVSGCPIAARSKAAAQKVPDRERDEGGEEGEGVILC